MLLQLLLQQTNPLFNQSFYESMVSASLRTSIESIIVSQRKTIERLQDQLTHTNQLLGTVILSHLGSTNYKTVYKLDYFEHKVEPDYKTEYITYTYEPFKLFQQIRDYIDEQVPVLSSFKRADIHRLAPLLDPDYVKLHIGNMNVFRSMVESIINKTAEYDTNDKARNNNYKLEKLPISSFNRICAFDFQFVPYQYASNYYLRLLGYDSNRRGNTFISLISIKRKEIALTIDTIGALREQIDYNVERFINELKNWRKFDPEYKGWIIVPSSTDTSTRLLLSVKHSLAKLDYLAYDNPYNEVDIFGEPILTKLPITVIDH